MKSTGTYAPPCCSICLEDWCLMCPSSTNMQRCLSRFACHYVYSSRKVTLLIYTNYAISCFQGSVQTLISLIMLHKKCIGHQHFLSFFTFSCWRTTTSAVGSTTACLMDGLILGWPQKRSYIFLVNSFGGSLNPWLTRWVFYCPPTVYRTGCNPFFHY